MNKKAPIYRTCVATRNKLLKEDMFRIVRQDNKIYFDRYQNMPGRGVYISKSLDAIKLAHKNHSLSRGLRREVSDEIYIKLIENLGKEGK